MTKFIELLESPNRGNIVNLDCIESISVATACRTYMAISIGSMESGYTLLEPCVDTCKRVGSKKTISEEKINELIASITGIDEEVRQNIDFVGSIEGTEDGCKVFVVIDGECKIYNTERSFKSVRKQLKGKKT